MENRPTFSRSLKPHDLTHTHTLYIYIDIYIEIYIDRYIYIDISIINPSSLSLFYDYGAPPGTVG